jgi:hypothetical protein
MVSHTGMDAWKWASIVTGNESLVCGAEVPRVAIDISRVVDPLQFFRISNGQWPCAKERE